MLSLIDTTKLIPGFEGPEKKLLFYFDVDLTRDPKGLRKFSQDQWQAVLDKVACKILSCTSNKFIDSYVLSESSLFVYPDRVMVKTCGTTTLLLGIQPIIDLAATAGIKPAGVTFSRRNFLFPHLQIHPHTNFEAEVMVLNKHFAGGHAFSFGSLLSDHWNVFRSDQKSAHADKTIEIMMCDISEEASDAFYHDESRVHCRVKQTLLQEILPGSIIDDFQFKPCGYSVNGLKDEFYWTVHVTPEAHCSYVSWETNYETSDYTELISKVVNLFKPGRFAIAFNSTLSVDERSFFDPKITGYDLSYDSSTTVARCKLAFFNYVQQK